MLDDLVNAHCTVCDRDQQPYDEPNWDKTNYTGHHHHMINHYFQIIKRIRHEIITASSWGLIWCIFHFSHCVINLLACLLFHPSFSTLCSALLCLCMNACMDYAHQSARNLNLTYHPTYAPSETVQHYVDTSNVSHDVFCIDCSVYFQHTSRCQHSNFE